MRTSILVLAVARPTICSPLTVDTLPVLPIKYWEATVKPVWFSFNPPGVVIVAVFPSVTAVVFNPIYSPTPVTDPMPPPSSAKGLIIMW